MKADAPNTGGGVRKPVVRHARRVADAFPDAQVLAFGFSLGSGVKGDYLLNSINFAGTRYTFAADVALTVEGPVQERRLGDQLPDHVQEPG